MMRLWYVVCGIIVGWLCLTAATAYTAQENVGDFLRSVEQGTIRIPGMAGASDAAPQSVPGTEILPEDMQKIFPEPLSRSANPMPLQPEVRPLETPQGGHAPLPMAPVTGTTQFKSMDSSGMSIPQPPRGNTPSILPVQPMTSGAVAPQMPLHTPAQTGASTAEDTYVQGQGASSPQPAAATPPKNATAAPFIRFFQGVAKDADKNAAPTSGTAQQRARKQSALQAKKGETLKEAWPSKTPSLACMVGQMLMVGFAGSDVEQVKGLYEHIAAGRVGGVILVPQDSTGVRNIISPAQVRSLTAHLQQAAAQGAGIPLLIAVEQEGGLVQALSPNRGFEGSGAAQKMGMGSTEQTQVTARRAGLALSGLGINMNLAPVADINYNPLNPYIGAKFRSFGRTPQQVAAHVCAYGQGLAAVGIIPCLKYFPGIGSIFTSLSASPLGGAGVVLPDMSGTWRQAELEPYKQALQQGWRGMVMPAMVYHRGIDALHPLSISQKLVSGVLRQHMGFAGVVISNDLQMLLPQYSLQEAIFLAVQAGVDIVFLPSYAGVDALLPATAHSILLDLVRQGRISEQRIRQSWERIMTLKKAFLATEAK